MHFLKILMLCLIAVLLAGCGSLPPSAAPAATLPMAAIHSVTPAAPPKPTTTLPPPPSPTAAAPTVPPVPTGTPVPTSTPEAPPALLMLTEPPIRHPVVAHYQQMLFDLGCREVGEINGEYNAQTAAAVRRFERYNHLPVDGAIDAATGAALDGQGAERCALPPPFSGRVLRRGMYVHALEAPALERLSALGYRQPGPPDSQGKFSTADAQALQSFQTANGLAATGALDLLTWERLFNPLAAGSGFTPQSEPVPWPSDIFTLDGVPTALALAGGKVWVARADGSLLWVEPERGAVRGPVFVGDLNLTTGPLVPEGMVEYGRTLFVYSQAEYAQILQGFDTASGLARPPITLLDCAGCAPLHLFGFDGRLAWLGAGDNRLRAVNPFNGIAHVRVSVEGLMGGLLGFDGACLWAPLADGSRSAVDPGGGTCRAKDPAYRLPSGLMVSDGRYLWVAPPGGGLDWYSAESATPVGQADLPAEVTALHFDGAHVWAGLANGEVRPILPVTGQVGAPVLACPQPAALASDREVLWAACAGDGTLRRLNLAAAPFPTSYPSAAMPTRSP